MESDMGMAPEIANPDQRDSLVSADGSGGGPLVVMVMSLNSY